MTQQIESTHPTANPTPRTGGLVILGLAAAAVALAVYATLDIAGGHFDEYYHVLAAMSLLRGEGFALGGLGSYERTPEYTAAVAAAMGLFGETLWAARLPSMLCMAAAVGLVTAWAGRLGGQVAGVLAGGLLLLNPLGLYIGTMCRFYAPQVLLILIVFMLIERSAYAVGTTARRAARSLLALVLLFAAFRLQPTTVFPATAALGWMVLGELGLFSRRRGVAPWRDGRLWAVVLAALAVTGLGIFLLRAQFAEAWQMLRHAEAWSANHRSDFRFYHKYLGREVGWWWSALPVMAVLACVRGRVAALMLTSLVLAGFIGQTLAGMKSPRYISYVLPAMSILWALGLMQLVPALARALMAAADAAAPSYRRLVRPIVAAASVGAVGWFLVTQPPTDVVKDMLDGDRSTDHPYVQNDWGVLNASLPPQRLEGLSLVASAETKALFHLGRVDAGIGVAQLVTHAEGELDPRTGRPTLASPEGLQAWMKDHPRGMLIAERAHYRQAWGVTDGVADYLETHMQPVTLDADGGADFIAWAWGSADAHPQAAAPPSLAP